VGPAPFHEFNFKTGGAMSFQGSLETLLKAFIAFYIACACVGRADIPLRLVTELRVKALSEAQSGWGCPSVFNGRACSEYDPRKYH
jgi:hypothetical protein